MGTLLGPGLTQLTTLRTRVRLQQSPLCRSVLVTSLLLGNCAACEQGSRLLSISTSFQYRFRQYLLRLHMVNARLMIQDLSLSCTVSQLSTHTINISLKPHNFPQSSAFKTTLLLLKKRGLPLFFL